MDTSMPNKNCVTGSGKAANVSYKNWTEVMYGRKFGGAKIGEFGKKSSNHQFISHQCFQICYVPLNINHKTMYAHFSLHSSSSPSIKSLHINLTLSWYPLIKNSTENKYNHPWGHLTLLNWHANMRKLCIFNLGTGVYL